MKKLLLIIAFMLTGLSGCYILPYGNDDGGYRRDGEHREDRDRQHDRGDHDSGRGGERGDSDRNR